MIFTTVSSTPSLMLITPSLLLLTLIRSSFRSFDSTIPTPFLPCLFAPLRINLHPPPNSFALSPFHLVSCTHNTLTFPLSIRFANSLPLPAIAPTFNVPTLTLTHTDTSLHHGLLYSQYASWFGVHRSRRVARRCNSTHACCCGIVPRLFGTCLAGSVGPGARPFPVSGW